MASYSNTCVFCQRNDSPPTEEHILPTWIMKAFPDVLEFKVEEDRAGRTFGATGHLGITSRRVCKRCNNGWMHDLEVDAEPILLPMMQGHTVTLTEPKQLIVSQWYLKTAMMLERRGNGPHFFTDQQRKAFSETLEVFADSILIFLARYIGAYAVITQDWRVPLTIAPNTDSPIPMDGYTATLTVKQLAAQFFAFDWPENSSRSGRFRIPGTWHKATFQIWPLTGTKVWPPPEVLDDEAVEVFIKRLGDAEPVPS